MRMTFGIFLFLIMHICMREGLRVVVRADLESAFECTLYAVHLMVSVL